jgi:hypothetical protein
MKTTALKSFENPLINFNITHDPHGAIQWKGTEISMDVHCDCGNVSHISGNFVYFLKCPVCGTVYELNGFIQLIRRPDISDKTEGVEIKTPDL